MGLFKKKNKDIEKEINEMEEELSETESELLLHENNEEKKNEESSTNMRLGFVLFDSMEYDFEAFVSRLKDWDINIDAKDIDIENQRLVSYIDGVMISAAFMPGPIPEGEAEYAASRNALWQNGVEMVKSHKTQMLITTQYRSDHVLEDALAYTNLCTAALDDDCAIGIYTEETVFEAKMYVEYAKNCKKDGVLPLGNLVFIGLYQGQVEGVSSYTCGLKYFGSKELEIRDSKRDISDVYNMMFSILSYIIESGTLLKDGETIGMSEDQKLQIIETQTELYEDTTLTITY